MAGHSIEVALEAIALLLKDPKDSEYQLLGVCALGRILRSPALLSKPRVTALLPDFARRLYAVMQRLDSEVGVGQYPALAALPFTPLAAEDESVHVLLKWISRKRDREHAVKLATYREAIACVPIALPPTSLQPQSFFGAMLLHSDADLASATSRSLQVRSRDDCMHAGHVRTTCLLELEVRSRDDCMHAGHVRTTCLLELEVADGSDGCGEVRVAPLALLVLHRLHVLLRAAHRVHARHLAARPLDILGRQGGGARRRLHEHRVAGATWLRDTRRLAHLPPGLAG